MELRLTKGVVQIDDDDFKNVSEYGWFLKYDKKMDCYYCQTNSKSVNGNRYTIAMHRFIMGLEKGDKRVVDHINHDTLDNRKSNLRVCTQSQNCMNRILKRSPTYGLVGVRFVEKNKNKPWRAVLKIKQKAVVVGSYTTKEEAHEAYQKASSQLFGEFKLKE